MWLPAKVKLTATGNVTQEKPHARDKIPGFLLLFTDPAV